MLKGASKKLFLLIILAITCIGLLGVDSLNSKERMDVSPLLPVTVQGQGGTGTVEILGEVEHDFDISSRVVIDFYLDEASYNNLTVIIFPKSILSTVSLNYSYFSNFNNVPLGSEIIEEYDSTSVYLYIDPVTGDNLKFYLVDGELHQVGFKGRTVFKQNGSLSYVYFDVVVSYKSDLKYINHQFVSLPDEKIYSIHGSEHLSNIPSGNDFEYSGSFSLIPVCSYRLYDGGVAHTVSTWSKITIEDNGSTLSKLLNGKIVTSDEFKRLDRFYLNSNTLTTISLRFSWGDGGVRIDGSMVENELDEFCNILSSKGTTFAYRGEKV